MNAIDYSLAFHSAISKRKDKNWYCADPNWKMAVESLALCGKFCLLAAKDKTYFMDRQAGNQAHNFQSAFRNRVVLVSPVQAIFDAIESMTSGTGCADVFDTSQSFKCD